MTTLREAAQQALEALIEGTEGTRPLGVVSLEAITALRAALAQPYAEQARKVASETGGRMSIDPVTGDVGIGTPDIHSCSYYCDRPACIKAQRDEMRDRLAQPGFECPRCGHCCPEMIVSPECAERGCAAHDDRVDGPGELLRQVISRRFKEGETK